uniref:Putative RNA-dependent RNA polymerase n=1 Tax=Caledonia beadlet anemone sobemo-like virus 1 TaxID=2021926 RepID=A0A221LFD7_9VIRU|nr:putative RNA-dependent RNA polymerase [Caledonia beadlet anemone sobemo-like virus 1]
MRVSHQTTRTTSQRDTGVRSCKATGLPDAQAVAGASMPGSSGAVSFESYQDYENFASGPAVVQVSKEEIEEVFGETTYSKPPKSADRGAILHSLRLHERINRAARDRECANKESLSSGVESFKEQHHDFRAHACTQSDCLASCEESGLPIDPSCYDATNFHKFQSWISSFTDVESDSRVLDPRSSPGHPWLAYGNTNGEAFGYIPGVGYRGPNCLLLYNKLLERWEELLEAPVCDPINPFIKQEGHKPSKVDEGRWRLISGVGATDQLVAELLFGSFMRRVKTHGFWKGMPVGWSYIQEGGLRAFLELSEGLDVCADRSSWDWTVTQPLAEAMIELLCFYAVDEPRARNHCVAMLGPKVFKFCGTEVDIDFWCMVSGWKLTLIFNLFCQILLHYYAEIRLGRDFGRIIAMGDDTLQEGVVGDDYFRCISETGAVIRDLDVKREFCGFHFCEESYNPSYVDKHSFNLQNISPDTLVETLTSYCYVYAFDTERFNFLSSWLDKLGSPTPDRDQIRVMVHGESRFGSRQQRVV